MTINGLAEDRWKELEGLLMHMCVSEKKSKKPGLEP